MSAQRAEATLRQLIPLESYRTPLVPTRQHDLAVMLGAVTPARQSTREPTEPTYWFAIDTEADALVAFARTALVSPANRTAPTSPHPRASEPMHPREAHAVLRETRPALAADFFAGRMPDAEAAARISAAYAAAIRPAIFPWIRTWCADFFDWLEQSRE